MAIVSVRIPQMGEGLQEARLVEFLKKPGDHVKRDRTDLRHGDRQGDDRSRVSLRGDAGGMGD